MKKMIVLFLIAGVAAYAGFRFSEHRAQQQLYNDMVRERAKAIVKENADKARYIPAEDPTDLDSGFAR